MKSTPVTETPRRIFRKLSDIFPIRRRELNNSKITNLESRIKSSMDKKNYARAGLLANDLKRFDSENPLAQEAYTVSLNQLEQEVQRQKKGNPRAAIKTYDKLIKINNWKKYRSQRENLKKTVNEFDGACASVKGNMNQLYENLLKKIDQTLDKFPDFSHFPRPMGFFPFPQGYSANWGSKFTASSKYPIALIHSDSEKWG